MNSFISFFNDNSKYIAIIIAVVVSLLVYINFNNIDLNKKTTRKLIQTVTVETFDTKPVLDTEENSELMFQLPPKKDQNQNLDQDQEFNFNGAKSFCENYRGKSDELNKAAKGLTDESCKTSTCCVLVQGQNGNTCMAGDVNGPTFQKDLKGNLISMDAYYYLGKRYPHPPTLM